MAKTEEDEQTSHHGESTSERAAEDRRAPASARTRRGFLKLGGAAAAFAVGGIQEVLFATGCTSKASAEQPDPDGTNKRRDDAYELRRKAAAYQRDLPLPPHPTNGDEDAYPNRIGSYSKALRHNDLGEVDASAYDTLVTALKSGRPEDFERIALGGTVRLICPEAAYAFSLDGSDSFHLGIAAPPAFATAEMAADMAEVYWMALARDVPFSDYGIHDLIGQGAADLSKMSGYSGPKSSGAVAPGTVFRGATPGDLAGPFVSQFLWLDIPYGLGKLTQKYTFPVSGGDHAKDYAFWLALQRGAGPGSATTTLTDTARYIRTARDLSEFVHKDFPFQVYLGACLYLLELGPDALNPANPYLRLKTAWPNVTFGTTHIIDMVSRAAFAAEKAAWYQKWLLHRRIRPEAFAGRVHNHVTGAAKYPIHADMTSSAALSALFSANGTYLLPLAYPEGSPTHPSYPAGHATTAGACITMLKAFFNEKLVLPASVVPSVDGLSLTPYKDTALTVGGELNKLGANIAFGRNFGGVHFRSEGVAGMKLGEAVAIGILTDWKATFHENFTTTFTKLDGTIITL